MYVSLFCLNYRYTLFTFYKNVKCMPKSNKKTKLLGWSKGGDNGSTFVHLFKNGTKLKILSGFTNLYKPLLTTRNM